MRVLNPVTVISNVSMTGNVTSSPIDCESQKGFSFEVEFVGTPTGTLKVEGSNSGTVWVDTGVAIAAAAGAAGSRLVNVAGVYYRYARLVYTFTSGTGTINAVAMAKQ